MDQTGGRMGQHLFRGSHLLNFAVVHENNEISKVKGFLHVVGDKDEGLVQLLLEGAHLLLEGAAGHGVQGGEGLIHQNDGRGGGQGPQDADALLLSTGHLRGVLVGVLFIGQVDHVQQLTNDAVALLPAVLEQGGDHADVLGHRHIGEQADLLDHIADVAAQLHLVLGGDVLSIQIDPARGWLNEAVDHLQRGGLSTAGRADEHRHLSLLDLKGEVIQDLLAAVGEGNVFKTKQRGTSLLRRAPEKQENVENWKGAGQGILKNQVKYINYYL